MKKIYKSLLLAMIASMTVGFTACEDDNGSNPTVSFPTSFTLNNAELAQNVYDLPYGSVNLTASQPNYGGWPASVNYAIQVSLSGNDGTWTELPTTYPTPNIVIEGSEINDVVLPAYRAAHNDEDPAPGLPIYLRSRAYLAETDANYGEVFSNAISIKVYSWEAPVELSLPTDIYICGNSIGDAWSTWKPVPLIWTKEGQFYTMIYNNADGFKWGNKPNDWFGYDMIDEYDIQVDGLEITADGDNNIVFSKAGWYVLKFTTAIDGKKVKYTLTVAEGRAAAIGSAVDNGSWSGIEMVAPEDKDGNWTFSDWTGSGELRAYIVVPGVDWWMTEFTVVDGACVWRDADHNCDQNWKDDVGEEYSISVAPGKTLYVNFDRATGYVE